MNLTAVWAVYASEMSRFRRTILQSFISPIISTSLYFVVFGSAIGSRIIDGFAKKMADQFFDNLRVAIEGPDEAPADGEPKKGWFQRVTGRD